MSDVVAFSVKRSKSDFFWAVFWATFRSGRVWLIYTTGALIVAAIAFFLERGALQERATSGATAFVLIMCLYVVYLLLCVVLMTFKNWGMVGAFDSVSYELSDHGMKVTSQTASGESSWAVWKSAFETSSLIIVRHQTGLVQVVPKRELGAAVLAQIREVLARNLGAGRAKGAS